MPNNPLSDLNRVMELMERTPVSVLLAAPKLLAACEAWDDYWRQLTRDEEPGDPLAALRNEFHAERIRLTREAVTLAKGV